MLHVPRLLRAGITDDVGRVVQSRAEPRLLIAAAFAHDEEVRLLHLATGHGDPKASAKCPRAAIGASRRRPWVFRGRTLKDQQGGLHGLSHRRGVLLRELPEASMQLVSPADLDARQHSESFPVLPLVAPRR